MAKKTSHGQAAIEFMVYFGFILLLFTAFFAYFSSQQLVDLKVRDAELKQAVVQKYADAINTAVRLGDGFIYRINTGSSYGLTSLTIEVGSDGGYVRGQWAGDCEVISATGGMTCFALAPLSSINITADAAMIAIGSTTDLKIINLKPDEPCVILTNVGGEIRVDQTCTTP
ncbi:Uncharacterised protein [Candidatus Gugararchaeum adminiculabundum]|nr:Uncharacterised protein [Candidatus Gugararchaeum adminiculabundum]